MNRIVILALNAATVLKIHSGTPNDLVSRYAIDGLRPFMSVRLDDVVLDSHTLIALIVNCVAGRFGLRLARILTIVFVLPAGPQRPA